MPLPSNIPNIFSLLEVVLRLRDSALVFNRNVGGGLEFEANNIPVANPDTQLPYAFVVPIDTVGKAINNSEYYQSREGIIGIVICVDGAKHKARADGTNPVQTVHSFSPIIAQIEDRLLSWRPIGFVLDGILTFERLHPLGSTENRAWVMLEYAIPFRFYHEGYGGMGVNSITVESGIRADKLKDLIVKYKAQGEFPTVVGEHFFDTIPLTTIIQPTDEQKAAFRANADIFHVNEAVLAAIADRHEAAVTEVPQTQDGPFAPGA